MGRTRPFAILVALMLLAGCQEDLYTGLSEREANEIVSLLHGGGIESRRVVEGGGLAKVRVARSDIAGAVSLLSAQGYPRRQYRTLGQVFEGGGLVSSEMEERARFVFAMSEELSQTISEIDGTVSARVHIVLPTPDPLARNLAPSSASVIIRHRADASVADLLPQIKQMVANSIEGLAYDKISVVFIPVSAPVPQPPAAEPPRAEAGEGLAMVLLPALGGLAAPLVLAPLYWAWMRRRRRRAGIIEVMAAE